MTWSDKLETLVTKSEFLFLETPLDVKGFLKEEYAGELVTYLELESMGLSEIQQGWVVTIFLYVLSSYSKGNRTTQSQLLSLMSSGLNDFAYIESAINTLEIKQVLEKRFLKNKVKQDIILEVVPATIDKVLHQLPLPTNSQDQIIAKKLLVFLKNNQIELDDYHLPSAKETIDTILKENKPTFVKQLNQHKKIKGDARYLMILLIAKYYLDGGISKDLSKGAISLKWDRCSFNMELSKENSILHELKLVHSDYIEFIQEVVISLSAHAINTLGLDSANTVKEKTGGGSDPLPLFKDHSDEQDFFTIIPNKLIENEPLFYNQQLTAELDFYKNLLDKEDKVFKNNQHIKGRIILMFDGLPGTGKTAAAQQLARQSKRDIIHVNWQTFRGQWVGQSEKNLKEMMDRVDSISMNSKRVPVVLFNEAEAFLSQRIAINQSTDRMENNLVSMLLEWLEKKAPFCIVIFTSNHRQLMDKAFERRISHITFDAPDEHTRLNIWKTLAVDTNLNHKDCKALVQYPLTGAEISQVLRTYSLHQIAYETSSMDIDLLHRLCQGQKWMENKAKIGFKTVE